MNKLNRLTTSIMTLIKYDIIADIVKKTINYLIIIIIAVE